MSNVDSLTEGVFSLSIDAIVLADHNELIQGFNPAAERLFGYSRAEIIGRKLFILLPEREWMLFQGAPDTIAQDELSRLIGSDREIFVRHRNGETRHVRVRQSRTDEAGGSKTLLLFRDLSDQLIAQEHVTYLSYFEQDTDLPNRAYLYKRLREFIAQGRSGGYLAAIEMNGLKGLIGTLSYTAIRSLMHDYGAHLQTHLPPGSGVFQTDQWQLSVLYMDIDSHAPDSGIDAVAERIYQLIREPLSFDHGSIYTDCTVGINHIPADCATVSEVLEPVDIALHEVITAGPHKISVYDPRLGKRMRHLTGIVQKLHASIDTRPFRLFVQPQYSAATGAIIGVEALSRWPSPDGAWITPAEFIPIAETTGLIQQLTDWCLHESCAAWKQWHSRGATDLRIAVNVSAHLLEMAGFDSYIKGILDAHGIPPRALELEITETALMRNLEQASESLNTLHALGISTAVDDFGTGQSSLSYLKLFKINKLKIDQSFVLHCLENPTDLAIVESVVRMGHALGYTVVAEGVETQAIEDEVTRLGCDEIQGYHRHRPMPIEDFIDYWLSYARTDTAHNAVGSQSGESR